METIGKIPSGISGLARLHPSQDQGHKVCEQIRKTLFWELRGTLLSEGSLEKYFSHFQPSQHPEPTVTMVQEALDTTPIGADIGIIHEMLALQACWMQSYVWSYRALHWDFKQGLGGWVMCGRVRILEGRSWVGNVWHSEDEDETVMETPGRYRCQNTNVCCRKWTVSL
jgi:hypothetical protein